MIFTSLGILIVAACFLIAGIIKSSVALLVVSLVATAAAAFILLATADLARRRAWEAGYLPQAPQAAPPVGGPVPVSIPAASNGAPILGYDQMTADQVVKLVSSGALTSDQLAALREYERGHASRKTVLDRVTRALR